MTYITVPLDSSYNKKSFCCGKGMLDDYLHKQASQDIKRKLCVVFVLPHETNLIKGYYTLSNNSIPSELVPIEIVKKLPSAYKNLPTILLGRLAVDGNFMRQGLGELLLLDALRRSYNVSVSSIGSMAVIVDPLDKEANLFYAKYGFIELPDSGKMLLPMRVIERLFQT